MASSDTDDSTTETTGKPQGGWFKIHRSLFGHWIAQDPDLLLLWVYLLGQATWKDSKAIVGGQVVDIRRGQVLTSVSKIARVLRWSRGRATRKLETLKSDATIELFANTHCTIITIKNYEQYQANGAVSRTAVDTAVEQQTDSGRAAVDTATGHIKEDIKKEKKNKKERYTRIAAKDRADAQQYAEHVYLTADQHQITKARYEQEFPKRPDALTRGLEILDTYLANNPQKTQGKGAYVDHRAVLCGWVLQKVHENLRSQGAAIPSKQKSFYQMALDGEL